MPEPMRWNRLHLAGGLLFLFIPLVLFLFVGHPEPLWLSLGAGVVLMLGHRRLARPYMRRALPRKCLWCNRPLPLATGVPADDPAADTVELRSGSETLAARCCTVHRPPLARFFVFLHAWRWPLRLGIFLPLLVLLATLGAAAAGREVPLATVTQVFKLAIGITVNVAALGYRFAPVRGTPVTVPFPVHNFFLLGVRNLLWIFRLVGLWWIIQGLRYFFVP